METRSDSSSDNGLSPDSLIRWERDPFALFLEPIMTSQLKMGISICLIRQANDPSRLLHTLNTLLNQPTGNTYHDEDIKPMKIIVTLEKEKHHRAHAIATPQLGSFHQLCLVLLDSSKFFFKRKLCLWGKDPSQDSKVLS